MDADEAVADAPCELGPQEAVGGRRVAVPYRQPEVRAAERLARLVRGARGVHGVRERQAADRGAGEVVVGRRGRGVGRKRDEGQRRRRKHEYEPPDRGSRYHGASPYAPPSMGNGITWSPGRSYG